MPSCWVFQNHFQGIQHSSRLISTGQTIQAVDVALLKIHLSARHGKMKTVSSSYCKKPSTKKNHWNLVKTPWDTVGSEIRRSPVEVGSWNPIIYRVLGPSQVVVWDFWTINSIITPQLLSTLHFQHRSWPMPLEAMWASHPMEPSCLVVSLATEVERTTAMAQKYM